jgi:metal-responsive CopG/Arc/MetJ family transcriptional regulator
MDKTDVTSYSARRSVRTTVSIPVQAYAEVERLAEHKKVSVAWVIRDALEQYLANRQPLFVTADRNP